MERRRLGRTSLDLSILGFGCGFVGGLMVRGAATERERAVARAVDLGVNYFDTAPLYGAGQSEINLGAALATLESEVVVGTKVMIGREERGRLAEAVSNSVHTSLRRLRLDRLDLLQLHNTVSSVDADYSLTADVVINQIAPVFAQLREQGKIRYVGFSGHGETSELRKVVESNAFDTLQVVYNLLNPSALVALPTGFPGQDYAQLLRELRARDMGAICIRALAGGALSGAEARHPIAIEKEKVDPLGSGSSYSADVARARQLAPLLNQDSADSLIEAALRYAVGNGDLATTVVGFSSLDQLEEAAGCVLKGPLSPMAMKRIADLQQGFVGEVR